MTKNIEDYLSKGCDKKIAQYFANKRKKIIGVTANDNFTLSITFDNGEKRLYNARPLLKKNSVFEPFLDLAAFRRVYLDNQNCISWDINPKVDSNKVWSNKVELCSDECYINSQPILQ